METNCCLVFDIGKTNQKYFVFNTENKILKREKVTIPKVLDEDGHIAENIEGITTWLREIFDLTMTSDKFKIDKVSFSGFGATLVHLDENKKVVTPVYDYHKLIDDNTFKEFYAKYGPESNFSIQTGSRNLGMLNSGKQLYWIKHKRPHLFNKIRHTLHLPQFLSHVFTGELHSEFTSIGCHTDLWDFQKNDYHQWVKSEGIDKLFPKIVDTSKTITKKIGGRRISFGIGIHDSSSALLTYLLKGKESFLLLSTGTWCINFNPFSNTSIFDENQVASGATAYMKIDGSPVKTSRLFLGGEHKMKVKKLAKFFQVPKFYHLSLGFNKELYEEYIVNSKNHFRWRYLDNSNAPVDDQLNFFSFEIAYHQLINELIDLLKLKIDLICETLPRKIYVDGGFSDNSIFLSLLKIKFPNQKIKAKPTSYACALGASMLLNRSNLI